MASSSSTFDPAAAMPGMRTPGDLEGSGTPESKRRKAVGDIDLDDDAAQEEPDAAMDVLLSLGMPASEA
eukprot:1443644-Heterocapsa_arctica.AAC.1